MVYLAAFCIVLWRLIPWKGWRHVPYLLKNILAVLLFVTASLILLVSKNYFFWSILQKDPLLVKVNKLTSIKTQLPYSYYSLPFCKPDTIVDSAENLGEVLRGDRIENSPYTVCSITVHWFHGSLFNILGLLLTFSHVCFPVWNEGASDVSNRLQDFCQGERGKASQGKDWRWVPRQHVRQ